MKLYSLSLIILTMLWVQYSDLYGQYLVKDIHSGNADSDPTAFTASHGRMYFIADDPGSSGGSNLWYYQSGIISFTDELTYTGSDDDELIDLVAANNKLYFFSYHDEVTDLWVSDGTTIQKIYEFGTAPGHPFDVSQANNFYVLNNFIFFSIASDVTYTTSLWVIDATTNSVYALDPNLGLVPDSFSGAILGDELYFFGYQYDGPDGLWRTNGTTLHYVSAQASFVGNNRLLTYDNKLYILALDGTNSLWVTNGSAVPTLISNLSTMADYIEFLAGYNGHVYFTNSNASETGYELWRTDGTAANTGVFADVIPGKEVSHFGNAIVYNSMLYFTAQYFNDEPFASVSNLYRTNGTLGSVTKVNINPTAGADSSPAYLTIVENILYLSADDGTHGSELWQIDGTTPSLVKDIYIGTNESHPEELTAFEGDLFFSADEATYGREPWHLQNGKFMPLWPDLLIPEFKFVFPPCAVIDCNGPLYLEVLILVFNKYEQTLYFPRGKQNYLKGIEGSERLKQPEYFKPGYTKFTLIMKPGATLQWVLTDEAGVSKTITFTAPENEDQLSKLQLYPIPAKEVLYFKTNEVKPQNVYVQIFDDKGNLVWKNKFDVSTEPKIFFTKELGLSKGIYFMKALFPDQFVETLRFLVE